MEGGRSCSTNEFRRRRRREKVRWMSTGARSYPFSLSPSLLVRPSYLPFISRLLPLLAPSSTYVGGLDGWSLFVFRYAKLRPGISRGLGKLRSPSTTADRKRATVVLKEEKEEKKKGRKKEEEERKGRKGRKRIYSSHARRLRTYVGRNREERRKSNESKLRSFERLVPPIYSQNRTLFPFLSSPIIPSTIIIHIAPF